MFALPPQGIASSGSHVPVPQTIPQPPQCLGFVEMSTATPPQHRCSARAPALAPSPSVDRAHTLDALHVTRTQGFASAAQVRPAQHG